MSNMLRMKKCAQVKIRACRNQCLHFCFISFLSLLLALNVHGKTLIHRYSFTSDASDSVGGANGTAAGGATFNGSGSVVLDGVSGHVSLPAGIVSNLTAVTIETWASFGTIANNSFLFG